VTHFLKRSGKPGLSHGAQRVRHPGVKTGRRHFSDTPREDWNIRQHANVLYTVVTKSQFLVQQDHVVWIGARPASPSGNPLLRS